MKPHIKHRFVFSLPGILFVSAIAFVISCGGSASGSEDDSNDHGLVTFKIDGKEWRSGPPGHPDLGYEEEATTDNSTMVRIEAFASDGSYIALTIYQTSDIGPGTYPITGTGMSAMYKESFSGTDSWLTAGLPNNTGSITISTMTDESVAGTFHFTIRNAGDPNDIRQITDGTFDLAFSTY